MEFKARLTSKAAASPIPACCKNDVAYPPMTFPHQYWIPQTAQSYPCQLKIEDVCSLTISVLRLLVPLKQSVNPVPATSAFSISLVCTINATVSSSFCSV